MAYVASPQNPETDLRERTYVPELLRGLAITARHFLRNFFGNRDVNTSVVDRKGYSYVTTIEYPDEKVAYPDGYRGLHRLVPREDGKPRCVACYMCATICPAQCIYIEAGEYSQADASVESRVIEKFPTVFVIDELRCIVCGFCVDACPKDAIRMDTYTHAPSEYTRPGFVWDISKLLRGPAVSHPTDPWNKRAGSETPEHVHKEAHTRIGEAAPAKGEGHVNRTVVTTDQPVPVMKFLKD